MTAQEVEAGLAIQQVSGRTGLSEATLRYYERIGLVGPVDRDPRSGHRRYGRADVDALRSLSCLRSAGMSVEDMRHYRQLATRGLETAAEQRRLFTRQADRLEAEIETLRLRLRYLQLKAACWKAREEGDARAEAALVAELIAIVEQF